MPETTAAATLSRVGTDKETRGQAIGRRMAALGMQRTHLVNETEGASRSLLYRVLRDEEGVREESYRVFEMTLDPWCPWSRSRRRP